ncbi:glutathione binding-like protein [Steroidobacter agaridevorans]|uniref:glutathione binding-like protein n=1 Tax=Steroidobacter agaridevorans TaxID=2695856 RepID=UPI00132B5CD5|nr:glutathione binding-like protein [Steroidobacter agaridevorans]GFE88942.1 glutathione S-transferase [Steroidobacter agaridevorans]
MNLYFSPLACSLATRIALYEAGAPAEFTQVDLKSKRVLKTGRDFAEINRLTLVPTLGIDAQTVLVENSAVLQFVADRFPEAKLAPTSGLQRARMQQWLGFINSELHKGIFNPLLDSTAPEGAKEYARTKVPSRFALLQDHFATHEFALEQFSIVDAYLTTILNWSAFSGVDLKQWPAVNDYFQRMLKRPNVARAMNEELALYQEEVRRRAS